MAENEITGVDHDLSIAERLGKATMDALDHIAENYPGCELESLMIVFRDPGPEGLAGPR